MKCPYFSKGCNAPICPEDPESMECGIWYPDEEICKRKDYAQEVWVRNQRKIKRKTQNADTYYTFKMLKRNCVIAKGITGIDPDKPAEPQIKTWFKKHPERKPLTEEQREAIRERFITKIQPLNRRRFM